MPPELLHLAYGPIPDYGELFRNDGGRDEADVWLVEVAARFGEEDLDPEGVEVLGSGLLAMDPYRVGITLEVHSASEVDACFVVPPLSAAEAAVRARWTLWEAADGLALERSAVVSVSMVLSSVVPADRLSDPRPGIGCAAWRTGCSRAQDRKTRGNPSAEDESERVGPPIRPRRMHRPKP